MSRRSLKYYPVGLKLRGLPALVAGGGKVAERKISFLLSAGAKIEVVSPRLTPLLKRLARSREIRWAKKDIARTDLLGKKLIIAATDDADANKAVSRWAREKKIWINVVDKPSLSDFISPAVVRFRKAVITVYTDGRDPVLSRDIKNFLKERRDDFLSYRHRLQKNPA